MTVPYLSPNYLLFIYIMALNQDIQQVKYDFVCLFVYLFEKSTHQCFFYCFFSCLFVCINVVLNKGVNWFAFSRCVGERFRRINTTGSKAFYWIYNPPLHLSSPPHLGLIVINKRKTLAWSRTSQWPLFSSQKWSLWSVLTPGGLFQPWRPMCPPSQLGPAVVFSGSGGSSRGELHLPLEVNEQP